MDKINEFAKSLGLDQAIFLKKWNGFDVYRLNLKRHDPKGFYGWGVLALSKGNTVREATLDEMYQFAMS